MKTRNNFLFFNRLKNLCTFSILFRRALSFSDGRHAVTYYHVILLYYQWSIKHELKYDKREKNQMECEEAQIVSVSQRLDHWSLLKVLALSDFSSSSITCSKVGIGCIIRNHYEIIFFQRIIELISFQLGFLRKHKWISIKSKKEDRNKKNILKLYDRIFKNYLTNFQ